MTDPAQTPTSAGRLPLRWTDLACPSDAELDRVSVELGVPRERLTAPSTRPRLEMLGGATLVVLLVPTLGSCQGELVSHELRLVFGGDDRLVTIHDDALPIFARLRDRQGELGATDLAAQLLDGLVSSRLEVVDMLDAELARLEGHVFETQGRRDHIRDVMRLRRHVSTLHRVVHAQLDVFESVADGDGPDVPGFVRSAFAQVLPAVRHIRILVESLQNRATIVADANEAFLGHTLNNTLKVLTVFSVIMIPPTLIASVFGMNVPVPLQESRSGFAVVAGVMIAVVVAFLGYLRRKGLM